MNPYVYLMEVFANNPICYSSMTYLTRVRLRPWMHPCRLRIAMPIIPATPMALAFRTSRRATSLVRCITHHRYRLILRRASHRDLPWACPQQTCQRSAMRRTTSGAWSCTASRRAAFLKGEVFIFILEKVQNIEIEKRSSDAFPLDLMIKILYW